MFAVLDLARRIKDSTKAMLPFTANVMTPDSASKEAAMTSSDAVEVFRHYNKLQTSRFIGFKPLDDKTKKDTALIIYPGAMVAAECYAPIARSMAELGYYAAIATPPNQLMIMDVYMAEEILAHESFKDVKKWAISGHSLGGVVSCHFAETASMRSKISGLALYASYPSTSEEQLFGDLSDNELKVVSIYGTLDGLTTLDEIETSKKALPDDTKFVKIEGGNHTQFYYTDGLQQHDNEATISRDEQQEQTRKAVLELLESL